jgi:serine phosphatase RsbU (regulator of sigma subunit)
LIGDATDKGIPAALVMATSRSLLRAIALDLVSPGKVLERANALLHGDIPANMFVTCLFLLFDPSTGRLRFANAGHCLPLVWNRDNIRTLKASGMPLGLLPGSSYAETETSLAPGEGFLLYTDGVIEARRPDGRMFEMGGLSAALCQHAALDGEDLIRALLEELIRFSGPQWKQEDDITLVVIK